MSNVHQLFPVDSSQVVHVNDETMSLRSSDQLSYRVWDLLDSIVEMMGNPDEPDTHKHWEENHSGAYAAALEAMICARVMVRRLTGSEPRDIQAEVTRLIREAYGIPAGEEGA